MVFTANATGCIVFSLFAAALAIYASKCFSERIQFSCLRSVPRPSSSSRQLLYFKFCPLCLLSPSHTAIVNLCQWVRTAQHGRVVPVPDSASGASASTRMRARPAKPPGIVPSVPPALVPPTNSSVPMSRPWTPTPTPTASTSQLRPSDGRLWPSRWAVFS